MPRRVTRARETEVSEDAKSTEARPVDRMASAVKRVLAEPIARAALALLIIFVLGLLFHADGAFYKWGTHRDMLRQTSVYGILACGLTVVIISGGIDLSVGSVLGLAAVVFSVLSIHWGWSPWIAVPAVLAVGAACGATSGAIIATHDLRARTLALVSAAIGACAAAMAWSLLSWSGGLVAGAFLVCLVAVALALRAVSRVAVQPFIATLAMMVFARGLAKHLSGGKKISQYVQTESGFEVVDLPRIYALIDSRILGDNLSVVTLIFLGCLLVSWLLLARFRPGRFVYAIGGNEESARLSGVPVAATKILAYGLCGVFSAVAGICQAAQETQGDPEAGTGYELSAIAIVVIGGTSLMGGKGGVLLTLLGTLTIGYLEKILSINAVGESLRLMLTGAIVVGAVLFQSSRRR